MLSLSTELAEFNFFISQFVSPNYPPLNCLIYSILNSSFTNPIIFTFLQPSASMLSAKQLNDCKSTINIKIRARCRSGDSRSICHQFMVLRFILFCNHPPRSPNPPIRRCNPFLLVQARLYIPHSLRFSPLNNIYSQQPTLIY